jgi:hypothetical protein
MSLERWRRFVFRTISDVAALSPNVATMSPSRNGSNLMENKDGFANVANVAVVATPGGREIESELKIFHSPPPATTATLTTNEKSANQLNALEGIFEWRQSGDKQATTAALRTPHPREGDIATGCNVYLDFETRNTGDCDLKLSGAHRYAVDPGTEIVMLTFQLGDHGPRRWNPRSGLRAPLAWYAADPHIRFIAFSDFELAIWEAIMVGRYGFPPVAIERWDDARAACSFYTLPRALDKVLPVIGSSVVKDAAGRRLTLSLSRRNRKTGEYPEVTPEVLRRVSEYNKTDVDGLAEGSKTR